MPFDFLKRKKADAGEAADGRRRRPRAGRARRSPFDGLTEDWRLVGRMRSTAGCPTRSTGASRSRITDVQWAPIDGSRAAGAGARAQGDRSVRPRSSSSPARRSLPAHDRRRAGRPQGPQGRPTTSRSRCRRSASSGRSTCTRARSPTGCSTARPRCSCRSSTRPRTLGDSGSWPTEVDAILVNRLYLRGVEQVDRRTGERHQKLPGPPLGGDELAGPVALSLALAARRGARRQARAASFARAKSRKPALSAGRRPSARPEHAVGEGVEVAR